MKLANTHNAASLAARIRQCHDDLISIARDIVSAIDETPSLVDELEKEGIPYAVIRRFEAFGRGQIAQELVFASSPAASRIIKLALSEQRAAIKNGIEVLEDDEKTARRIPLHSLTPKQAALAIARDHVRDLAEQRTLIREKLATTKPATPDDDFKVFGDRVVTRRPLTISRALLVQWLSQMK